MTLSAIDVPCAASPNLPAKARAFAADFLTPGRFAILLFALLFCAYPKIILGTGTFYFKDFGVLSYPTLNYHHQAFWRGELPMWNPLNDCGAPFLAQWGTLALYPFSLVYLLFPMPWSLNWFSILHLLLAGMGMYLLAMRWTQNRLAASLAGIGYVFNGATISSVIWPNYLVAIAWMPLIVCFAERARTEGGKWIIYAALAGAMQMLSGVPELTASTWLVVAVLWAIDLRKETFWRDAGRVAIIVAAVSALSAAQLLPFFELLKHSPRGAAYDIARWTMPPSGWGNLILPLFQTAKAPGGFHYQPSQQFMLTYYGGIFLVVAGFCAVFVKRDRRTFALFGLLLFALLFALGSKGFVYDWIRAVVPQVGFARYTIKLVSLCAFVLPLLAAITVAAMMKRAAPQPKMLSSVFAVVAALVAGLLWFDHTHPLTGGDWNAVLSNAVIRLIFFGAALGLVYYFSRSTVQRNGLQAVLVAVVAIDLIAHAPHIVLTIPVDSYAAGRWAAQAPAAAAQVKGQRAMVSAAAQSAFGRKILADPHADFLGKRMGLYLNLNVLDGVSKIDGAMTLLVKEEDNIEALLYANPKATYPPLMDFLGASIVSDPENPTEWVARSTALPLLTAGQRPVFLPASNILAAIASPEFNPRDVVYLGTQDREQVAAQTNVSAQIKTWSFKANRVSATVEASAPSMVVLAQTYYPCWQAFIDRQPVRLFRANHAFQAVAIPAGSHEIELRYRDTKFFLGAAISLCALAMCGAYLFLKRQRGVAAVEQMA